MYSDLSPVPVADVSWKITVNNCSVQKKTTGTTFPLYKKERERRSRSTRTLRHALHVLCAQLTRDLIAIVNFFQSIFMLHFLNMYALFRFFRAMRCISAAYVVMRCLSVCPSITFVNCAKRIKIFEIFSPF